MKIQHISILALALATGYGAPALAQETASEGEDGAVTSDDDVLTQERVTVTALRRETALEDTPLSISAFDGDELSRIGADGLEEFLQFAPGVQIGRTTNGAQSVFIRGLTSTIGNTPVGFYIDEVPFTALSQTITPDVRSWDLERVEVLRGPQGTLYGASSLGGTIRIITNDPVLNEFEAAADLTYSTTEDGGDNSGFKGMVNVPLVEDRLSLRVAGTHEQFSGWIDQADTVTFGPTQEDLNDFDISTGRAKLLFTPNERFEITLGYSVSDSESGNGNIANESQASTSAINATRDFEVDTELASAEVKIDLGFANLTSSTSYYDFQANTNFSDYDGFPGAPFFLNTGAELFTQEFRLASQSGGNLFWTVGAIYTENESTADQLFLLPSVGLNIDSQQLQTSESYALYGEATYQLSDQWAATVGLRYFEDEIDRQDEDIAFDGVFLTPPEQINNSFDDFSPRFNLAWTPNEDTLVFGTVSRGFRSGNTQAAISLATATLFGVEIPEEIDPEEVWNYEIGSKVTLFDGRVTLDGVLYFLDYSNLQTQVGFGQFVFGTINTGSVEGRGFEFAANVAASESLSFALSGNFNNTEFAETIIDSAGNTIFTEGQSIPRVPELTLAGSVDYTRPISPNWNAVGRASFEYNSEREVIVGGFPDPVTGDDNTRVNLRLGVENGRYGVFLTAENLFNDDSAVNPAGDALGAAGGFASRYRPRTIGLNLSAAF